jgi:Fe-S cluster assembly protein SufD
MITSNDPHNRGAFQPWPNLFSVAQEKKPKEKAWLQNFRLKNWERFNSAKFPSTSDDDWKYTDLTNLTKLSLSCPDLPQLKLFRDLASQFLNPGMINLLCVNGFFLPQQLQDQVKGRCVEVISLKEETGFNFNDLLAEDENIVSTKNIFSFFSNAFFSDGLIINIPPSKHLTEIINIIHLTSTNNTIAVCPRIIIHVGESAQATIIEKYIATNGDSQYLIAPYTSITIGKNAVLHYGNIQNEQPMAYHLSNTVTTLDRDSSFESFFLTLGAVITRNNLAILIKKPGASVSANGLCLLKGNQLADNHTFIEHLAPETKSVQTYKSIVFDAARNVFEGRILVHAEAQKTNSYQINKNLLMGKNSRVDTKPQLEIFADDVKCSHGATVGQLNEDVIFYLQTRGINRSCAISMLAQGFADEVVSLIKEPAIALEVRQALETVFPH